MIFRKEKSIIFFNPDYHCTFFYRTKLEKLGWLTSIYVSNEYPKKLLYSDKNIKKIIYLRSFPVIGRVLQYILNLLFFLHATIKYKHHFYYGGLDVFDFSDKRLYLDKFFGEDFKFHLWFSKKMGNKITLFPAGCRDVETKENFSKFDNGNVCNNCGWSEHACHDKINLERIKSINKYCDFTIGDGWLDSSLCNQTHIKYKSLDLNLWKPNLEVPSEYNLPKTNKLRILHSFYDEDRNHNGKNIKGSPAVLEAINKLKEEGFNIEYMYINNVPSNKMRFYQVQSDICIEQLIYGCWGSTGVETTALGKPVILYLNKSWKKHFLEVFSEYKELPFIEANTSNIYEVLKNLISNQKLIKLYGKKSRKFAESHFDINKNGIALEKRLLKL